MSCVGTTVLDWRRAHLASLREHSSASRSVSLMCREAEVSAVGSKVAPSDSGGLSASLVSCPHGTEH